MTSRESYFIRSEGPDIQSTKKSFQWLLGYPTEKGFLAVMEYKNLEGVIKKVLGERCVKGLVKTGTFRLQAKEIFLVTERKFIYDGKNLPVLAFWPDSRFLDKLDDIPNVSAMLVVPWIMKEVEPWIKTWNATELGEEKQERAVPLVKNKVVEQALKSLTAAVNVETGIDHPLDRNCTIQTFTILKDGGETFSPEEVKAWLMVEGGWKAIDAQEVAEIAQKILEGRRLKTGAPAWREDILEFWREEA